MPQRRFHKRLIVAGISGGTAVALSVLFTVPLFADGGNPTLMHACVKKQNGQVRIVEPNDNCLPPESSQHWAAGTQGNTAGSIGNSSFEVIDANGRLVGNASAAGGYMVFHLSGRVVRLFVGRDGFRSYLELYFASNDCTGTPWIESPSSHFVDNGSVAPPGMTVYVPDPADVPTTNMVVGSLLRDGTCHPNPFPFGSVASLAPAVSLIDMSTLFTPPFAAR